MFNAVKRWKRILVRVLIVAQLVTAAPFASAMPAAESMPCAEMGMASMPSDADECPCCPAGDSVAACLAACVATAGITSSFALPIVPAHASRASVPIFDAHSRAFDPPLKPPPIA